MTHHPNWFTAAVLSTVLGAFCFLSDQDYRDEFGRADELQAIQQEETAKASREFAGRAVCGPGAVHEWIGDKEITCHPKRGRSYQVVRSEPWAISQK
jgi:hypothetical protein